MRAATAGQFYGPPLLTNPPITAPPSPAPTTAVPTAAPTKKTRAPVKPVSVYTVVCSCTQCFHV